MLPKVIIFLPFVFAASVERHFVLRLTSDRDAPFLRVRASTGAEGYFTLQSRTPLTTVRFRQPVPMARSFGRRPPAHRYITILDLDGGPDLVVRSADGEGFDSWTTVHRFDGILSVHPESAFAYTVSSVMFVPLKDPQDDSVQEIHMMTDLEEPSEICEDELLGYAEHILDGVDYFVRTEFSLIQSDANENLVQTDTVAPVLGMAKFDIGETNDSVPESIYRPINDALVNLVQDTCINHIDYLPSIQYTVLASEESNEPVVHIILGPRDYLSIDPQGRCTLRIVPAETFSTFGMNFMKRVGLLFDFRESRVGFCEPLTPM